MRMNVNDLELECVQEMINSPNGESQFIPIFMSIAVSLKRIADKMEQVTWPVENGQAIQILKRD